jgi:ABC-type sugar transport system ATPase subunit
MAELVLREVTRRFASGGGVSGISLRVASGEFLVLLGPSGCGKSTLLRLIAGLEHADSGEIEIGGVRAGMSRDMIAMVFQNFALYPHMSAFDNIAFPLRLRAVARAEIETRVTRAAQTAGLAIDLRRLPGELSGGERQRVALARALVREPAVILMDEPLSSLDAKLRAALRIELKEFQRRTARTIVYVTHDQAEALGLADRIAVMRAGRIEQIGTPEEIYARPASQFIAGFVGTPEMNLLRARRAAAGAVSIDGGLALACEPPPAARDEVVIGFRPDEIAEAPAQGRIEIEAEIETAEFTGSAFLAHCRAGAVPFRAIVSERPHPRERRRLFLDRARLHFFDPATGSRIE